MTTEEWGYTEAPMCEYCKRLYSTVGIEGHPVEKYLCTLTGRVVHLQFKCNFYEDY